MLAHPHSLSPTDPAQPVLNLFVEPSSAKLPPVPRLSPKARPSGSKDVKSTREAAKPVQAPKKKLQKREEGKKSAVKEIDNRVRKIQEERVKLRARSMSVQREMEQKAAVSAAAAASVKPPEYKPVQIPQFDAKQLQHGARPRAQFSQRLQPAHMQQEPPARIP